MHHTIARPILAGRAIRPWIDRLARTTARYPFRVWGFGESIALEGLLAAGGDPRAFAAHLIDRWARDAPPLDTDPLAHVAPGVPLLQRFQETREPALLLRAQELATVLSVARVGVHGIRLHRPDLAGWEHEAWVDCMHLDGPFLARLGVVTGEARWADLAAELLVSHARVLQHEPSGLFSHGFDDSTGHANEVFWGRGQGWALLGLVDTYALLPPAHPCHDEIRQRTEWLIAGLVVSEATPGSWHTVVDHPETYIETSVAAFVALGVRRAARLGIQGRAAAIAERAWAATVASCTAHGEVRGVSDATPVGADAAHYGGRGRGVFPWGQGPALLAALERDHELAPENARG